MGHDVTVVDGAVRPTVVVAATTTWQEFPALWGTLLDEVWACVRARGIERGCRNVMLYRDDLPTVEVGVLLDTQIPLTGRVIRSALPHGVAAKTVHYGPYAGLADAHRAVAAWCAANGRRRTGVRWEIYGPHDPDPARTWTEVYHQL